MWLQIQNWSSKNFAFSIQKFQWQCHLEAVWTRWITICDAKCISDAVFFIQPMPLSQQPLSFNATENNSYLMLQSKNASKTRFWSNPRLSTSWLSWNKIPIVSETEAGARSRCTKYTIYQMYKISDISDVLRALNSQVGDQPPAHLCFLHSAFHFRRSIFWIATFPPECWMTRSAGKLTGSRLPSLFLSVLLVWPPGWRRCPHKLRTAVEQRPRRSGVRRRAHNTTLTTQTTRPPQPEPARRVVVLGNPIVQCCCFSVKIHFFGRRKTVWSWAILFFLFSFHRCCCADVPRLGGGPPSQPRLLLLIVVLHYWHYTSLPSWHSSGDGNMNIFSPPFFLFIVGVLHYTSAVLKIGSQLRTLLCWEMLLDTLSFDANKITEWGAPTKKASGLIPSWRFAKPLNWAAFLSV